MILQAVCQALQRSGVAEGAIAMVDEADFACRPAEAEVYVSMARSTETLQVLDVLEQQGRMVVNSARAVRMCRRSQLDALMRGHGIAMPPLHGDAGYWLKRGDEAAQHKADIIFCKDRTALEAAFRQFEARGITDCVVSAHVPGDLVKFYGVGTEMFRYFYPSDDGISKFGDEKRNGKAHHYVFDASRLQAEAVRLSQLTGMAVYGGDAIIDEDGNFYIIDFNDWPSFSRCRDEAAVAIASLIANAIKRL